MKTKESIKSKVDQLNTRELRIVERLIDSLKSRKKIRSKKALEEKPPYKKVIDLIGSPGLVSGDIQKERQERL